MPLDRNKRRAVTSALGQKDRRRRKWHRGETPPLAASQFSLAALVLLVTLSSFVLAITHYRGPAIVDGLGRLATRLNTDARNFRETSADEIVPLAAAVAGLVLAILLAILVARLHSDRGVYVVWFVTCIAALGLIAALSLDVEPLAETKVKWLRLEQIAVSAFFWLSCLLPVGAGLGWYVKFTATK